MHRRFLASVLLLATAGTPMNAQRPVARPSAAQVRMRDGAPRSAGVALDGEALRRRRRQFAGAGAVAGAAGAVVWALASARDEGTARVLTVLVLPVAVGGGAVAGGLAGYALSFVVYPPRRAG
jgi:hypothetical protein